ncbi:putative D-amino-acid transaminase, chloroplastic [Cocos nucifera]|uniref:Putative D-amino-acid transaminase, chloroplastic n=1 Tax=Cocos nucifera TaxID=13894 RepID=A0A8K0I3D6_COCNU|nr:putative D-amino-acid transaminase, chloroplastic [Cocos nucifera]
MASLPASSLREPVSGNPPFGRIAGFPGVILSPRRPRVAFHGGPYRGFGVGVEGRRCGVRAVTSSNWAGVLGLKTSCYSDTRLNNIPVNEAKKVLWLELFLISFWRT